ncbi:hypothetical protein GCM10009609_33340 [Pseudonocardia aurantiaca]|uniref:CaiB/BaiF CoA transferase family protein n=1 Tax=Pseudonocardia aurantiaca TaxID=75290 RepID=A0ABW4FQG9_9PSEU
MSGTLPFDGLRVIDLGSFWAAPYLTTYLGAYGADVVKVESVQRPDGFRFTSTQPALGDRWFDRSLLWQATNLNKRCVTVGLRSEQGKDLLRRLCADADVFVENYAARVVEQFGFDYEGLRRINPSIIVLRLPGFGLAGPWRDYVGWGNAFEQIAGLAWVTGFGDGRPQTPGGYIDPTVGMHAAVALLAAVEHRERTGEGQLVEVPQIEVGASMTAEQLIVRSSGGTELVRQGNRHPVYAPQGVYRCAAEPAEWVALSVRDNREWRALRRIMGDPPEMAAPVLDTVAGRQSHHDELDRALQEWSRGQDVHDVVSDLRGAGVPVARVLVPAGFNEDPQLVDRQYYQEVVHPLSGKRRFPGYPMRFSFESARRPHRRPAPRLGEHNEEILGGELGLTPDELAAHTESGVIGTAPAGA